MDKTFSNFCLMLFWALVISAGPFMFLLIEGHPYKLISGSALIIMVAILLSKNNIQIGDRNILLILALQITYFNFAALYHSDSAYISFSIRMISIAIIYIFLNTLVGIDKASNSVIFVMQVIGIFGVLGFFGALTGYLVPIGALIKSNNDLLYNYVLTFSNSVFVGFDGIQLIRISGFFDEPGALAYYLIHALIINKLLADSKRSEAILIISGLFTLSIAFYITVILYYMFFNLNLKNYKYFIASFIVAAAAIAFLNIIKDDNALTRTLYSLTSERLQLSDDSDSGIIKGNNRSESIHDGFEYFQTKPIFGHGFTKILENSNFSNASIIANLAVDGIVGLAFIFMHVLYLCGVIFLRRNSSERIFLSKALFLLILNYIQRPYVNEIFSYMIIIFIVSLAKEYSNSTTVIFTINKDVHLRRIEGH